MNNNKKKMRNFFIYLTFFLLVTHNTTFRYTVFGAPDNVFAGSSFCSSPSVVTYATTPTRQGLSR